VGEFRQGALMTSAAGTKLRLRGQNAKICLFFLGDLENGREPLDDLRRGTAFFRFYFPQGNSGATDLLRQLLLCQPLPLRWRLSHSPNCTSTNNLFPPKCIAVYIAQRYPGILKPLDSIYQSKYIIQVIW